MAAAGEEARSPLRPAPPSHAPQEADYKDSLAFWGLCVPPKSSAAIAFDEEEEALVHVTQARASPPASRRLDERRAPPAPVVESR